MEGLKVGAMKIHYIIVSLVFVTPSMVVAADLPYREQTEAEVCAGERYIDPADMQEKIGVKNCTVDMDAIRCSSITATDCVVMAPLKAVAVSELDPGIIEAGKKVLGVTGTADESYQNPACSAPAQQHCQVVSPFKSVNMAAVTENNIKDGISLLGLTGKFGDPDPMPDCSASVTVSCFVKGQFMAVASNELQPGHIRNGIVLAGIAGDFPSAASPLDSANDNLVQLSPTHFNDLIASGHSFRFYDSKGVEHVVSGSNQLVASNIAENQVLFGIAGTAKPRQDIDFTKVRKKAGLLGGQGQLKTNCRNAFPEGVSNVSFNPSIADDGNTRATKFKWGDETRCYEELWENVTKDNADNLIACTNSNRICVYRNIITGLRWRKDPDKNQTTRDAAAQNCASITDSDGSPWRLPTHKELLQAYVHGIRYIAPGAGFLDPAQEYWTSSSRPSDISSQNCYSSYVKLSNGENKCGVNTNVTFNSMCVK